MSLGQGRIERERLFGGGQARLLRPSPEVQECLAEGDRSPGASIVRVDLQRSPAESNSDFQISRTLLRQIIPTQEIELIGLGVMSRAALDRLLLGRKQSDLERRDDGLRDFVLHRKDVFQFAVIALSPDVAVLARVD